MALRGLSESSNLLVDDAVALQGALVFPDRIPYHLSGLLAIVVRRSYALSCQTALNRCTLRAYPLPSVGRHDDAHSPLTAICGRLCMVDRYQGRGDARTGRFCGQTGRRSRP